MIYSNPCSLGGAAKKSRVARRFLLAFATAFIPSCAHSAPQSVAPEAPAEPERPAATAALPVTPATGETLSSRNPFEGAELFVNPHYAESVDTSIQRAPELAAKMEQVKRQPTALWLDRIAAIEHVPEWLDQAERQSSVAGKPVVPVFVVYDLPNRDCAAKSSAGELHIEEGGEERYRSEYIDVIAQELASRPSQRVVVVLEPDSLPNLVSNMDRDKCAASHDVYIHSVAYAISKLSLPNVAIYVDAAHAGWLGWDGNRHEMALLMKKVLDMAGGVDRVRGFATNVSNYNALEGDWGKKLESSNPSTNELAYVDAFRGALEHAGVTGMSFVVDTSRNGQPEIRTKWGNWCNVTGAGIGERPRVAPRQHVDAYLWIKPPGESDGTADRRAERFDDNCVSADATPGAPEAGQWFHDYFVTLVENASPPL